MRFILALIMLSVFSQPTFAKTVPNTGFTETEVAWLAKNVYFEARNQGIAGQLAVAMVTIVEILESLGKYVRILWLPRFEAWDAR